MGTHGYKRTKFRGRYWTILYTKDGYPEHLGDEIVNAIPSDSTEYQEWYVSTSTQIFVKEETFSIQKDPQLNVSRSLSCLPLKSSDVLLATDYLQLVGLHASVDTSQSEIRY